jgi:hypothetical protein
LAEIEPPAIELSERRDEMHSGAPLTLGEAAHGRKELVVGELCEGIRSSSYSPFERAIIRINLRSR